MPPTGICFAVGEKNTEPGWASMNGTRHDGSLDQIFLFREFHSRPQNLLHGKSSQDDALATAFIRWLDYELMADWNHIQFRDDRLFNKRRQENRVWGMYACTDQLKVHGGFVFRPF